MNIRKKTRQTKYERQAALRQRLEHSLHGEGLYLYRNNTKGTLMLPKPTPGGVTRVEAGQEFEGDNYYMSLVRANMLSLVRELISPEKERQQKVLEENTMNEEKLILDQPSTVTDRGVVEQVVAGPKEKEKVENLQEGKPQEQKNEVLLNDDPLDGVQILG